MSVYSSSVTSGLKLFEIWAHSRTILDYHHFPLLYAYAPSVCEQNKVAHPVTLLFLEKWDINLRYGSRRIKFILETDASCT